jgi:hypothetical protein
MSISGYAAILILALVIAIAIKKMRPRRPAPAGRRRAGSVGPAASGAFYELLNEERRNAIEIVIEDKAAYRDPEDADGNLPDLEDPRRRTRQDDPR